MFSLDTNLGLHVGNSVANFMGARRTESFQGHELLRAHNGKRKGKASSGILFGPIVQQGAANGLQEGATFECP